MFLKVDMVLLFRIEMEKGTKTKQTKKDALILQGVRELPRDAVFTKLSHLVTPSFKGAWET